MSLVSLKGLRCISSAFLGVLFALSLKQESRCYTGYIAVNSLLWLLGHSVPQIYTCFLSPDSRDYLEINVSSLHLDLHSSAPRVGRIGSSRARKAFIYSVSAGLFDALTLRHTYSPSDRQILAAVMTFFMPKRLRAFFAVYTVYLWYLGSLPAASDVIAVGVLLTATWLGMAQQKRCWLLVRFLSASVIATQTGVKTCATKLSAVAPSTIIVLALFQLNVSVPIFFAFAVLAL